MATDAVGEFIERWKNSGAAERANYQLFLIELSEILGDIMKTTTIPANSSAA